MPGRVPRGTGPAQPTPQGRWGVLPWRRLPVAAEVATIGAGYFAYSLAPGDSGGPPRGVRTRCAALDRAEAPALGRGAVSQPPHRGSHRHRRADRPLLRAAALPADPLALALLYFAGPLHPSPGVRAGAYRSCRECGLLGMAGCTATILPARDDRRPCHRDVLGAGSPHGPARPRSVSAVNQASRESGWRAGLVGPPGRPGLPGTAWAVMPSVPSGTG